MGANRLEIAEYFTKVSSAWFLTSHVLSEFNTGSATKFSNFFNKIIDELNCKLKLENTSYSILVGKCLLCPSDTVYTTCSHVGTSSGGKKPPFNTTNITSRMLYSLYA